jgi:hypothetical protein
VCDLPRNGSLLLTDERGWKVKYSGNNSWRITRGIVNVNFIARESMTEFLCSSTAAEVKCFCIGSVLSSLLYE